MEAREYFRDGNETAYRKVCETEVPSVNSRGLGTHERGDYSFFKYTLPVIEIQIVLVISLNILLRFIFKRIGLPKLITHLVAGLAFGQLVLYLESRKILDYYLPILTEHTIGTLSDFGYMLVLFTIAVKMDMKIIATTGKRALAIGSAVFMVPLIADMVFVMVYGTNYLNLSEDKGKLKGLVNLAVTESMTTFPVISYLLSELKIINSELGRLASSSAILSEAFSLSLLTVVMLLGDTKADDVAAGLGNKFLNAGCLVVFLLTVVFIYRPAMFWVIRQTPEGRPVKDHYLMIIIIFVLLMAKASDEFGQFVLFAPYVVGLATPDGPPLGSALANKLETLVSAFLLPVFITLCSARVTFAGFDVTNIDPVVGGVIILSVITFVTKVVACLMVTVVGCNMPFSDGLSLSLIMSSKGIVELATYTFMRDTATITEPAFATIVMTTMLQSAAIPLIIKKLYDPSRKYAGYQKRNITHLRPKDEFRVLICIHRPDNVGSAIKLLDTSSPTRQSPIAVFVIHIIELVGRTIPVFISHQYQTRTVSDHSYSENVILAFDQYEESKDNYAISVQTYTAISPPKLMHEDICTLALNKLTSLIIMPFHRKWGLDGTIESENPNLRVLNCNVLNLAPCSVGILIDRSRLIARSASLGNSSSTTKPRVGMIFIGGHDDREAFVYAKRMAQGPGISDLSVIRYVAKEEEEELENKEWDWMVDAEVLKEVKINNANGVVGEGIRYREEMVSDGPEMALRIREMVDEFDLLIVGRRYKVECSQTSGLEEWSEFPELGVVGDLLASPDMDSRTSVLVVQQQLMANKS